MLSSHIPIPHTATPFGDFKKPIISKNSKVNAIFATTDDLLRGIGIPSLLTPLGRLLIILVCALARTLE